MIDTTGNAPTAGPAAAGLVDQTLVLCPACGAWSDVWSETCACGGGLLADTRKLRILKSSAEPKHLMEKRAKTAEESQLPAQWEQAVRDLAALRRLGALESASFPTDVTVRIARLLLKLGRLGEAVVEASTLQSHKALPADMAVTLSREYEAAGDLVGADAWIERGLDSAGDDLKARVPLVCERARLLTDHDRAPEAMLLLKGVQTELDAAIKATEKSGGATAAQLIAGGDAKTYAISFWSAETKALDQATKHAKSVLKAQEHAEHAAAKAARAARRAAEGKTHWWER